MKKYVVLTLFLLLAISLGAKSILKHIYYSDYEIIDRVVFVFDKETNYSVTSNSDEKELIILIPQCTKNKSLLPLALDESNRVISNLSVTQWGQDLQIKIICKEVFYAENFKFKDGLFKIVVDIYNKEKPESPEEINQFKHFYEAVGYEKRIKKIIPGTSPSSENKVNKEEVSNTTSAGSEKPAVAVNKEEEPKVSSNPLKDYQKPEKTGLKTYDNYINSSFRVYQKVDKTKHSIILAQKNLKKLEDSYKMQRELNNSLILLKTELSDIVNQLDSLQTEFRKIRQPSLKKLKVKKVQKQKITNSVTYTSKMVKSTIADIPYLKERIGMTIEKIDTVLKQ